MQGTVAPGPELGRFLLEKVEIGVPGNTSTMQEVDLREA